MKNGLRVVLLEEEGLIHNVLVKALADWGYVCEVPEDEDAVWAAVRRDAAPTVVVADWHTDILDCGDFFRKVRRVGEHCHLVVGIPRSSTDGIHVCIRAGAHDFVYRPYNLDEVQVRLHAIGRIMGLPGGSLSFD